ncbi:MAG: hypothetical protein KatS3mg059_0812 [Thermomicrobiales bacterium]|nr:MAG: hypothetical protein KatS3mg059_0812 [Thermomicrobiales bacterium]
MVSRWFLASTSPGQLSKKCGLIQQICHADASPCDFIRIGWTNAAERRTDSLILTSGFFRAIQGRMVRQDQMGTVR